MPFSVAISLISCSKGQEQNGTEFLCLLALQRLHDSQEVWTGSKAHSKAITTKGRSSRENVRNGFLIILKDKAISFKPCPMIIERS